LQEVAAANAAADPRFQPRQWRGHVRERAGGDVPHDLPLHRGAQRSGDSYVDDNIVHTGGFGQDGSASPKDPTKPGVFLYVTETPAATFIDVWENVPKAP
jgi:hypothetical protein